MTAVSEGARRQARVSAGFRRFGETVTTERAGVGRDRRGVFAPLDLSASSVYFDANEAVGLVRPGLLFYLDGADADPPLAGDIFTRDGRLWTVRKVQTFRLGDTPLLVVAVCD